MAKGIVVFKKFYSEFTKVLPMIINNLVTTLYSSGLLTGDKKESIDSLPTNKEKTEYLLDKVIRPGLEIEFTKLFDEMLTIMRTSDDLTVNYLVDKIEQFTLTSSLSPVEQMPIASQGNHICAYEVHMHTRVSMHACMHLYGHVYVCGLLGVS